MFFLIRLAFRFIRGAFVFFVILIFVGAVLVGGACSSSSRNQPAPAPTTATTVSDADQPDSALDEAANKMGESYGNLKSSTEEQWDKYKDGRTNQEVYEDLKSGAGEKYENFKDGFSEGFEKTQD